MAKETITGLIGLISGFLVLLNPNETNQNKRILRRSFRNYRKIKKMMKADNVISIKEKEQLERLKDKIIDAQFELLDF